MDSHISVSVSLRIDMLVVEMLGIVILVINDGDSQWLLMISD